MTADPLQGLIYDNFEIRFLPEPDGQYVLQVTSPAGDGKSLFTPPFGWEHIKNLLQQRPEGLENTLMRLGGDLFQAVFAGTAKTLYDGCIGRFKNALAPGLRFRLHLDPSDEKLAQICRLPWELLFDVERAQFLARDARTPIVRHQYVPLLPHKSLAIEPPLRILLAGYDAPDREPLFLQRSRKMIEKALAHRGGVKLDYLDDVSVKSLREKMRSDQYHILHYMGHGFFDENASEGGLLFRSVRGSTEAVPGEVLADTMRGASSLKLVFLDACNSGLSAYHPYALAGTASALLTAGVPAVIAMQFPIFNETTTSFSEMFYRDLAEGGSLEQAVAEGRNGIRDDYRHIPEWLCPVLYLRAADGRFFAPGSLSRHGPGNQETLQNILDAVNRGKGNIVEKKSSPPTPRPMQEPVWIDLVSRVKAGSCFLFLGTHFLQGKVNALSGARTRFANQLLRKMDLNLESMPEPFRESGTVAQLFQKRMGSQMLSREASKFFHNPNAPVSSILANLAALPFPYCVNLSPGAEWEKALEDYGKKTCNSVFGLRQWAETDLKGNVQRPMVIHPLGCHDDALSFVLTEQKIFSLVREIPAWGAYKKASKNSLSDTMLLVGVSFEDWFERFLVGHFAEGMGVRGCYAILDRESSSAETLRKKAAYLEEIYGIQHVTGDLGEIVEELKHAALN